MSTPGSVKSNLSANEKRQLVAELLRKRDAEQMTVAPLTCGQKALIYLNRAHPTSCAYNALFAAQITGSVNVKALRRALQKIVDRHSILRATYGTHNGDFVQWVQGAREVDFQSIEAEGASLEDLEARWIEEATRAYVLDRDASLRVRLYSRCAGEHVLVISVHHIGFDYWSYDVFVRELQAFYRAATTATPAQIKPLSLQVTDHARAQETMLAGPRGACLWEYWKRELQGDLPVLQLPLDRPRPPRLSTGGATYSFEFAPGHVAALRALALQRNTTLYVLFLAAFQVLLHRYSGQDDIIVGSPVACRNSSEAEDLIGYFANIVPVRVDLAGDPPFNRFLEQVHGRVIGALEHQEFPFALLVEKLGCKPDASRSPILDVAFAWEKSHVVSLQNGQPEPLKLQLMYARQLGAPYDLTVLVFEREHEASATLLYNCDLFEPATMARMANHFQVLLDGIVAQPERRVSSLPLISDNELRQIVEVWNASQTAYPRYHTVPQLFEQQVERWPNAVAAQFNAESLTYQELNQRANQLAHYLRQFGIRGGALVAICVERSLEMLVGILAILKAGAAYVPLDPTYPSERLAVMLQDANAWMLLTQQHLAGKLPPFVGVVLCFDSEWDRIAQESSLDPLFDGTAEDLAYVMYTSGSTGIPKGIEIPQRAISRLVLNTNYISLGPDDRVAQASNSSFDAATFEIWGALLNGACLVGISKEVVLSPSKFAAWIRAQRITTLFLTTALFNQLAQETPTIFRTVKNVLFGGEAVEPRYVARVLAHGRPKRLLHVYGPTESTTFATWHTIDEVPENTSTIPIGRPVANTTVYVLDRQRRAVPIGAAGELYIGGDGLARGYLKSPELTAEKFVQDTFTNLPGARLYRTGDLVRCRPDGAIEFLGRIDQQIKIRGLRIEPGEIAWTLRQHDSVHDAIVVMREQVPGEKRLVAYVARKKPSALQDAELRTYLKQKLPEYMVPSALVIMDALPLTPNGKVDHCALPAPETVPEDSGRPFIEPESDLEQTIASIWQRALHVERISRYDNFFDLGGHSLLLAKLHEEMQQATGKQLAIVDMFRFPTVNSMAAYLSRPATEERSFDDVRERARRQRLAISRRVPTQQPRKVVHEQP